MDYLVQKEGLSKNRFIVRWFGETRPVASNDIEEGRELNRRVELKGEINQVKRSKLFDQYRTEPSVYINQTKQKLDPQGRFSTRIEDEALKGIEIDAMNSPQPPWSVFLRAVGCRIGDRWNRHVPQ